MSKLLIAHPYLAGNDIRYSLNPEGPLARGWLPLSRPAPPTTQNNTSSFTVSGVKNVNLVPGSVTSQESSETSISEYTEPVFYVRSRNIEFDASSLKPVTRFYPFFSEVNISDYIIPKLLEIEMISGVFEVGETVESDPTFIQNKIYFRLCAPPHKTGEYSNPETFYDFNPYTQQQMPDDYSASSTFLNVDTKSLGLPSETSFYGCVSIGMTLIGKTSGAVAKVSNVRLISDRNGRLIGSFFIPDASQFGSIKFINGVNVFTLLDVESLNLLANSESFAESNYTSSAVNNITEANIVTTRNVEITFPYLATTIGDTPTSENPRPPSSGGDTTNIVRSRIYSFQKGTVTYGGPGLPFGGITIDLINEVGLTRDEIPRYGRDLVITDTQRRKLRQVFREKLAAATGAGLTIETELGSGGIIVTAGGMILA